jgi:hypothetical protein
MKLVLNNLKIELENQQEIRDFWNVISFALDLHAEREKDNKSCMTEDELKLAKKLIDITEKSWDW